MNPTQRRNVEEWITALRSGEYTQCDRALHRYNDFCCLGVLLNLHEPGGWIAPSEPEQRFRHVNGHFGTLDRGEMMPDSVWFRSLTGLDHRPSRLAAANDAGKSFEEIADMIEGMISSD